MYHKFYVVVDEPKYKQEIHDELMAPVGDETVPNRPVDAHDLMPHSEYNGLFYLTQDEADALMSDLRVAHVHRIPEELGVKKSITGARLGTYSKATSASSGHINWGLVRSINTNSNAVFGTGYGTTSSAFTFNLDGTGVDIIVMDSGVEPGHPEFAVNPDGTGGSRVVDYDWTQHGIITSAPTGGFLGDFDGHGSNCASIAAGNTNGWAPGSRVYSLRCVPSDDGSITSIYDGRNLGMLDNIQCWQSIRAFHLAKTADPKTGYKRPTIVTASYGYITRYDRVTSINYRGTAFSVTTTTAAYGTIGVAQGGNGYHGSRYPAEEAEVTSCINAGVVVVSAAGNYSHKTDVSTGTDYNNFWTNWQGFTDWYHRGSCPSAVNGVINVGCMAGFTNTAAAGEEHKRSFSECGPRVDIWAPGDYIMGAYANKSYAGAAIQDSRNTAYYLNKISGTSQACPQVTGVVACLLQIRPWFTATNCLNWINGVATDWPVNENYYGGSGYTNLGSLQGSPKKALYNPFKSSDSLKIS
jgi:hypothetical protein